jgi:hypothetical protein
MEGGGGKKVLMGKRRWIVLLGGSGGWGKDRVYGERVGEKLGVGRG